MGRYHTWISEVLSLCSSFEHSTYLCDFSNPKNCDSCLSSRMS